jgi:hypothetical protein
MTKHRSHGAAFKRQVTWGLIPKAPLIDSWRGSPAARFLTLGAGDSRHTISGEIARRLFGGRASHARRSKDVSQSRHLLSLAAVRDGMDRAAVAKIGSMDRQRLRDWVHRFNASGRHRQPHGKAATGWAGAPRFGDAAAYPFFIRRPSADIRRWPSPDVEPVRWCGIVRTLVQPEMIMPKNEHNDAAEHPERAAKSHRTAAAHHDKGDHDAGHKHSEEAHGHSSKAHERSTHAHGKSGEAKSSKR